MAKNITKSDRPQKPKRKSTAAEKGSTLEKYCSEYFSCYQQQVHIIDAIDATAINVVLKNIRNALIGARSKVRICRRCFRRQ